MKTKNLRKMSSIMKRILIINSNNNNSSNNICKFIEVCKHSSNLTSINKITLSINFKWIIKINLRSRQIKPSNSSSNK